MKIKIITITILVLICALTLCGCRVGNRKIGFDTTQTFRWAIIRLGNGEIIEGAVDSWRDFEDGDEIQLTIGDITYLTHYSNVILTTKKP